MAGIINKNRETKVLSVICPKFGETFSVEFNTAVDGSLYLAIKNDGTKIRGVSKIHMRSEINFKRPYFKNTFVEKSDWRKRILL